MQTTDYARRCRWRETFGPGFDSRRLHSDVNVFVLSWCRTLTRVDSRRLHHGTSVFPGSRRFVGTCCAPVVQLRPGTRAPSGGWDWLRRTGGRLGFVDEQAEREGLPRRSRHSSRALLVRWSAPAGRASDGAHRLAVQVRQHPEPVDSRPGPRTARGQLACLGSPRRGVGGRFPRPRRPAAPPLARTGTSSRRLEQRGHRCF